MAAAKEADKKIQFTLVVEFDDMDEATIEGVRELTELGRGYGSPIKAELTNLPTKMTFI